MESEERKGGGGGFNARSLVSNSQSHGSLIFLGRAKFFFFCRPPTLLVLGFHFVLLFVEGRDERV